MSAAELRDLVTALREADTARHRAVDAYEEAISAALAAEFGAQRARMMRDWSARGFHVLLVYDEVECAWAASVWRQVTDRGVHEIGDTPRGALEAALDAFELLRPDDAAALRQQIPPRPSAESEMRS